MPICDECRRFIYRKPRRAKRADPAIEVWRMLRKPIAQCIKCGEEYKWLPDNFDMMHRFNRTTHEYCGGCIVMGRALECDQSQQSAREAVAAEPNKSPE